MRVALGLALVLLGCGGAESPEDLGSEGSGVEREIRGFTMTETHDGSLLWELEAEYAWRIPQEHKVHLEELEMVFYDNQGIEASRLTARRGSVDEETGILTTEHRVKLISVAGDTLTTEELTYDKENDLVSGPGFVRLAKPDRVLTGFDFQSTPDLSDYEVREDVTITIVDDGENIKSAP